MTVIAVVSPPSPNETTWLLFLWNDGSTKSLNLYHVLISRSPLFGVVPTPPNCTLEVFFFQTLFELGCPDTRVFDVLIASVGDFQLSAYLALVSYCPIGSLDRRTFFCAIREDSPHRRVPKVLPSLASLFCSLIAFISPLSSTFSFEKAALPGSSEMIFGFPFPARFQVSPP